MNLLEDSTVGDDAVDANYSRLIEELRNLFESSKLTYQELANRSGPSLSRTWRILNEINDPPRGFATLAKLGQALGMELTWSLHPQDGTSTVSMIESTTSCPVSEPPT